MGQDEFETQIVFHSKSAGSVEKTRELASSISFVGRIIYYSVKNN